jgi:hypothetical protein
MEVRMRMLWAISVLAFIGIGAPAADKDAPEFITKPGEYKLHDSKVVIRVKEEEKVLRFGVTYTFPRGSLELSSTQSIDKAEGWFVFSASANEVWLYKGGDQLQLSEFKAGGGPMGSDYHSTTSVGAAGAADLLKRAPKAVVNRLADEFKKQARDK